MKITVIATGFDESRSRLVNMVSRTRPAPPSGLGGIVSEKPRTQVQNLGFERRVEAVDTSRTHETPEEQPVFRTSEPEQQPEQTSENTDWDIPAFLRKGR